MKFNIGYKVKVKTIFGISDNPDLNCLVGEIGIIRHIERNHEHPYGVKFCNMGEFNECSFAEDELELLVCNRQMVF